MNLSVLPASCRQKKLGSADETSAARCWGARSLGKGSWLPMRVHSWRLWLSMNLLVPDRGCVQRTSRSARATQGVPEKFEALRYADVLRLVLRTQPRSDRRSVLATVRVFV